MLSGAGTEKFLEGIVHRVRKYTGSLVTGTWDYADFSNNAAAKVCLTSSDTFIALKQKLESIDTQNLDSGVAAIMKTLTSVPGQFSEMCITTPGGCVFCRLLLDPFSLSVYSSEGATVECLKKPDYQSSFEARRKRRLGAMITLASKSCFAICVSFTLVSATSHLVLNLSNSLKPDAFLIFKLLPGSWRGAYAAFNAPKTLDVNLTDDTVLIKRVVGLPEDPITHKPRAICLATSCFETSQDLEEIFKLWRADRVPYGHIAVSGDEVIFIYSCYAAFGSIPIKEAQFGFGIGEFDRARMEHFLFWLSNTKLMEALS